MADKLTNQQKKEWAQQLYVRENFSQIEIASKTGASKQSICKWVKEGQWDKLKASVTITREEQIGNLYRQLEEINNNILNREPGQRVATSKEADTINKLASAIEKMERELGISEIISVSKGLLTWLRSFDVAKAQEIAPIMDNFIKHKIR